MIEFASEDIHPTDDYSASQVWEYSTAAAKNNNNNVICMNT
jgi:hypothetical protein